MQRVGKSETERWQVRRTAEKAEYAAKRQTHAAMRYRQVLEVDRLKGRGLTTKAALARLGIARSVYDDWKKRLADEIA